MKLDIILEHAKSIATIAVAIIIPIIIAIIGNRYTSAIKEHEVQVNFVELVIRILDKPPSEGQENIRLWAIDLLNKIFGIPMDRVLIDKFSTEKALLSNFDIKSLNLSIVLKSAVHLIILAVYPEMNLYPSYLDLL